MEEILIPKGASIRYRDNTIILTADVVGQVEDQSCVYRWTGEEWQTTCGLPSSQARILVYRTSTCPKCKRTIKILQ